IRLLYISASPTDCVPLETGRSYEALERAVSELLEQGQIMLDRLEPVTYDALVTYFSSFGGAGVFDDNEITAPCYAVHFDGHGAYGRLCPDEECGQLNEADARKCVACDASLSKVKAQTYLSFCNDEGCNRYIDTQSLRELLVTSDVRLAVFSACETATIACEVLPNRRRGTTFDTTLATALVTAQVPAVVAMP